MATQEVGGRTARPEPLAVLRIVWNGRVVDNRSTEEVAEECRNAGADYVTNDLVENIRGHLGFCEQLLTEAQSDEGE